jgi:hypothetical protein
MIVFDTPGLIDLRAFTLMGVSAKPNSTNPIGYFGTGLKYAIATLVRLGAEPVLWRGDDRYTFFKRPDEFRGVHFSSLAMRRDKKAFSWGGRVQDLPFAESYGRNWEPWMAFRELESNTRDEVGVSYLAAVDPGPPDEGNTRLIIDLPAFTEAWEKRDEVFLPSAVREGTGIQIVEDESTALYWRGLKVYTLPKPSVFTYNILDHMDLTEDRTLKWEVLARLALGDWLLKHDDEAIIEKVLTVGPTHWENDLQFNDHVSPSRAFHNVAVRHPKNVAPAFWGYYSRHDERVVEKTFSLFEAHPLPWTCTGHRVEDARGTTVFDCPYKYEGKWELAAESILKMVNPLAPAKEEEPDEPIVDGFDRDTDDFDETPAEDRVEAA